LEYGPDANLAFVASLMADRHRAQMLLTLLGGTPQSGSALAEAVGISRSLASAHLKKLVTGGLVRAQPSGRQQLYSIASAPVADALGRRGKWARRAGEPLEAASRISHSK
jgi:DNA-binding transcriptional ArsR family regulator